MQDKSELAQVGRRFQQYFRRRGLTAQQVALKMDIHPNQLTSMVNGTDFNLRFIFLIATHFPVLNVRWLLTGEGDVEPNSTQRFDVASRLQDWRSTFESLKKQPLPQMDRHAKKRVQQQADLLNEALFIRMSLLALLADVQGEVIEQLA